MLVLRAEVLDGILPRRVSLPSVHGEMLQYRWRRGKESLVSAVPDGR